MKAVAEAINMLYQDDIAQLERRRGAVHLMLSRHSKYQLLT
jgi:hypothetical protein